MVKLTICIPDILQSDGKHTCRSSLGARSTQGGRQRPSPWLQGQINAAPIHGWLLEEKFVLLPLNFIMVLFPSFSAATSASRDGEGWVWGVNIRLILQKSGQSACLKDAYWIHSELLWRKKIITELNVFLPRSWTACRNSERTRKKRRTKENVQGGAFVPNTSLVNGMPFNQGATREHFYHSSSIYNSTRWQLRRVEKVDLICRKQINGCKPLISESLQQ